MAEDLAKMWMNLSLKEDEIVEWEAPVKECEEVSAQGQFCVVGKLIGDRFVSKETIKTTFSQWWKLPMETFSFKVLGENVFLVEF